MAASSVDQLKVEENSAPKSPPVGLDQHTKHNPEHGTNWNSPKYEMDILAGQVSWLSLPVNFEFLSTVSVSEIESKNL